jgi:2-oxoglutarate ferredoxin oxidoreductase subunit alpha
MTERIVNDFSIIVGTANGSGSTTANSTILRAIFKMGIPVSGKNPFPSNIQGLPTWYTIRVSKEGFTARRETSEIVIAMNPASFARDLASVVPGGAFFYADDIKQPISRDDIAVYAMPVKTLVRSNPEIPTNLRDLVANMVYVGILAYIIGIDLEMVEQALRFHFKGKEKPIVLNMGTVSRS